MTCIHENEVNKTSEYNLLHDIINPYKHTKNINSHNSPILHGFANKRKGKSRFNNSRILLDSWCSYTIVKGKLIKILILNNIL